MNGRLDQTSTTESLASRMSDLERLGELVAGSRAAFGLRFDPVGERIALVNERGELIREERALLVLLDLVAAESRGRQVALPVTTTRVAEQVCRFHGVNVIWTSTSPEALTRAAAQPAGRVCRRRTGRLHRARNSRRRWTERRPLCAWPD